MVCCAVEFPNERHILSRKHLNLERIAMRSVFVGCSRSNCVSTSAICIEYIGRLLSYYQTINTPHKFRGERGFAHGHSQIEVRSNSNSLMLVSCNRNGWDLQLDNIDTNFLFVRAAVCHYSNSDEVLADLLLHKRQRGRGAKHLPLHSPTIGCIFGRLIFGSDNDFAPLLHGIDPGFVIKHDFRGQSCRDLLVYIARREERNNH